jgi:hypothetical protein
MARRSDAQPFNGNEFQLALVTLPISRQSDVESVASCVAHYATFNGNVQRELAAKPKRFARSLNSARLCAASTKG